VGRMSGWRKGGVGWRLGWGRGSIRAGYRTGAVEGRVLVGLVWGAAGVGVVCGWSGVPYTIIQDPVKGRPWEWQILGMTNRYTAYVLVVTYKL